MPRDLVYQIESGCELLAFLINQDPSRSRKRAKDLLRFGAVTVKGKAGVRHDTLLRPGDVVSIAARDNHRADEVELHGLKIVHLDEAVVIVDKPAGLLSMGSEAEKERTAHRILNEYLKRLTGAKTQQAFIVHRIDRETSGLIIFARSGKVQAALQQDWKSVTKKYLAIVEGLPMPENGTLTDRLREDASMTVRRVKQGGEIAITHYSVRARTSDMALVELTLDTGRKHQIRVQLAGIGHPIAGDPKYGARTDPALRLALHSCALSFRHPVSGEIMEFHSPLPQRLQAIIGRRAAR